MGTRPRRTIRSDALGLALAVIAGAGGCLGEGSGTALDAVASDVDVLEDVGVEVVEDMTDDVGVEVVEDATVEVVDDATEVVEDATVEDVSVATEVVEDVAVVHEVTTRGCFDDAAAGFHTFACEDVTYDVEVPPECLQSACGLIVDIHGWTMTSELEDLNTLMRQRGREAGFVVVQPSAPLFVGVPTWDLNKHAEVIFAFVSDVAAGLGVDPNRRYVMGFSQGGGLTWQLVCAHADFFAAAAPLGALPGCAFDAAHHPSEEVDVMAVHGRLDSVVAFSQLESQRDDALAYWDYGAPAILADDADHTVTRWTTPSGNVLEVWEHDYTASSFLLNGHCMPGSPDLTRLPLPFGCQQTGTFVYAAEALAFFQAHPRRAP